MTSCFFYKKVYIENIVHSTSKT